MIYASFSIKNPLANELSSKQLYNVWLDITATKTWEFQVNWNPMYLLDAHVDVAYIENDGCYASINILGFELWTCIAPRETLH